MQRSVGLMQDEGRWAGVGTVVQLIGSGKTHVSETSRLQRQPPRKIHAGKRDANAAVWGRQKRIHPDRRSPADPAIGLACTHHASYKIDPKEARYRHRPTARLHSSQARRRCPQSFRQRCIRVTHITPTLTTGTTVKIACAKSHLGQRDERTPAGDMARPRVRHECVLSSRGPTRPRLDVHEAPSIFGDRMSLC